MQKETRLQFPLFTPTSEWTPPFELRDITGYKEIAIDLETKDPRLKSHGPGWATGHGDVVGIAVSYDGFTAYLPFGQEGGGNLDQTTLEEIARGKLAAGGVAMMLGE